MASEVVYADILPKERVHFISQTSDTGNAATYSEVKVKWRSYRPDSTPKTTHAAICLKNLPWCYIAFILYFTALILLITVILSAMKCYRL